MKNQNPKLSLCFFLLVLTSGLYSLLLCCACLFKFFVVHAFTFQIQSICYQVVWTILGFGFLSKIFKGESRISASLSTSLMNR
jgi:hypothetical protein